MSNPRQALTTHGGGGETVQHSSWVQGWTQMSCRRLPSISLWSEDCLSRTQASHFQWALEIVRSWKQSPDTDLGHLRFWKYFTSEEEEKNLFAKLKISESKVLF